MTLRVLKFGGTSVGSAPRIASSARLVEQARTDADVVVVSSAMSQMTNRLIAASDAAAKGDDDAARTALEAIRADHHAVIDALELGDDVRAEIDRLVDGAATLVQAVGALGERSPRAHDRLVICGEKMAVRLLAATLRVQGIPARALDADTFIETDGRFGAATPLAGLAGPATRRAIEPLVADGVVPVITGFCGHGPDGATTTLGRGGSDYSATFIGAEIGADEVIIWTDVAGVYSADPRVVPGARPLAQLNYREAAELAFYGAKVLHPRTLQPVASHGIPVYIRDSFHPDRPGTSVDGRMTPGSHPVRALSAIRGHALLTVEGRGMAGVPGVAARLFRALADTGVSVTAISQSSAESSITVAIPGAQADRATAAVRRAFRMDMSHGDVEDVSLRADVGLVAAVGLGMARHPGIAGRLCTAFGASGVNVLAIAQGSSELNITIAVDADDVDDALRAAHDAFGLHLRDTGADTETGFDVVLVGLGSVGRRLATLIADRAPSIRERFGLEPRVVAALDSSGMVFEPTGLDDEALRATVAWKQAGHRLADAEGGTAIDDSVAAVAHVLGWRFARPVVVDTTAWDGAGALFERAARAGADVVTANKWPLAAPAERWAATRDAFTRNGRMLRAEATVGAGLLVVDTLEMLHATGDVVRRVEGCLSGTLAHVLWRVGDGMPLVDAVLEAADLGYTEPDPVIDLLGTDVARKARIIARLCGWAIPEDRITVEPLVPAELRGAGRDALVAALTETGAALAERVAEADRNGRAVRHLAVVEPDRITVGLRDVDRTTPFGGLQGTDNMFVVVSDRYADRPLTVQGPGAGVDVTAMGLLADLLRVVAERAPTRTPGDA